MRNVLGGLAVWVAGFTAALGPAFAQPQAAAEPEAVLAAPEDLVGRMTAPVFINGHGPFDFIVDTGANRSALSQDLAARLSLPWGGESEVHAFTGVFTAPLAQVELLSAGAVSLSDVALPVIDTTMLADADGLLGVEAMANRRLIFDFETQRIVFERAGARLTGSGWFGVRAERRFGNLFVLRGAIGRVPVRMIIDTGANQSFANTALRRALRGTGARTAPVTGTRLTAAGARPVVLDQTLFIPRIDFATMEVRNVVAYVGDLYIFDLWGLSETPTLVIGMDFLSHIAAFALDYSRGTIYFRSRRAATERGSTSSAFNPR